MAKNIITFALNLIYHGQRRKCRDMFILVHKAKELLEEDPNVEFS